MKFVASRLSEGNKVFPAEIHIEEVGIKVKIPGFLSGDTKFINYENISGVDINSPMIGFSSITFFYQGNKAFAHGFTKDDASQIQEAINQGKLRAKVTTSKNDYVNAVTPPTNKTFELQPEMIIRPRTKEDIDLEYYEKQKELELEQQRDRYMQQKTDQVIQQKSLKYDEARQYLANGGNKAIYYYKLLLAYLDKPWKKILFVIIIWWLVGSLFSHFPKNK